MILKETILSAFTERGTLLKWLKKVEAALNNAVLSDISVEQISDTQVKLKFTFENGDFVESPVLTLPRGEKGEPGKDGLDGEGIAATIEVGTVTTGAAGTNASVTNAGTSQRAILNFVIPRGATGEQGSAGVGFDDADELSINDGALSVTAGDNGVNITAFFEIAVGDETLEIPSTMYLPLKGSESIVIDVDESGEFIDVHLDANIAAKLARVLVTPMSAPASISLVAVDTSNAQTMLTLGSGLSVSGGVLSASGGGGGGGTSLYKHILAPTSPTYGQYDIESIQFISNNSTPLQSNITLISLCQIISNVNYLNPIINYRYGDEYRRTTLLVYNMQNGDSGDLEGFIFGLNNDGTVHKINFNNTLVDEVTPL